MTNTPTYFDWIPTKDVIHEMIMPMLDYESRIQFNQSLKPIERMSWRFPAADILAHDLIVAAFSIKYSLDRIADLARLARLTGIEHERKKLIQKKSKVFASFIDKFKEGSRERMFLNTNVAYHRKVINKIYEGIDPHSDMVSSCTPYFKKKLGYMAHDMLLGLMWIKPRNRGITYNTIQMKCAVAVFV